MSPAVSHFPKFEYDYFFVCFRQNNIDGVLDTTFSVENNSFGVLKVHELKPGGAGIPVTEDNKREYVKLYVNYRFMRGIEQQFLALQKGFSELIPATLLRPFDERELELLISGIGKCYKCFFYAF